MMTTTTHTPHINTAQRWSGFGLLLLGLFLLFPILLTHWANWWACFIALPAVFLLSLGGAMADYSRRLSIASRAVLSCGLVIATVTLMFLLKLSWAVYWPLMIIVPCAGLLSLTMPLSRRPFVSLVQQWLFWLSLAGLLLGFEFLLARLDVLPLYLLTFRWWSLNILLIFLGGLWITAKMLAVGCHPILVLANLLLAACIGCSGFISFLDLTWTLLPPLYLLSIGFLLIGSALFQNSDAKKL